MNIIKPEDGIIRYEKINKQILENKWYIGKPDYDWTGYEFNNIKVLSYFGTYKISWVPHFLCQCRCGNKLIVRACCLRDKKTKSCGCSQYPSGTSSPLWKGYGEISSCHFSSIKSDAKSSAREFSITIEYLWNLFLKQNRKCVISGVELYFELSRNNQSRTTASLDRIDSSKGYIEGNVQWLHKDINKLKRNFDEEYFISICHLISKNNAHRGKMNLRNENQKISEIINLSQ